MKHTLHSYIGSSKLIVSISRFGTLTGTHIGRTFLSQLPRRLILLNSTRIHPILLYTPSPVLHTTATLPYYYPNPLSPNTRSPQVLEQPDLLLSTLTFQLWPMQTGKVSMSGNL